MSFLQDTLASRLFDRSLLEDYVTELFADLLYRCEHSDSRASRNFLLELTGVRFRVRDSVTITTQFNAAGVRPDLSIKSRNAHALIENKLDSPVKPDQIFMYHIFLRSQEIEHKVVVLLRKWKQDLSRRNRPNVDMSWNEVSKLLSKHFIRNSRPRRYPSQNLSYFVKDFISFLEEQDIVARKVSSHLVRGVRALYDLSFQIRSILDERIPGSRNISLTLAKEYYGMNFNIRGIRHRFWTGINLTEAHELILLIEWRPRNPSTLPRGYAVDEESDEPYIVYDLNNEDYFRKNTEQQISSLAKFYESAIGSVKRYYSS